MHICHFVIFAYNMNFSGSDLMLDIPFANRNESVNSQRYFWNNATRGEDSFVIIQWTHSGEGRLFVNGRSHPLGPGRAMIAMVPEASRYGYPDGGGAAWTFSWVNFYGTMAKPVAAEFRRLYGPAPRLADDGEAGRIFFELVALARSRNRDPHETTLLVHRFWIEWSRELAGPVDLTGDPVTAAIQLFENGFRDPHAMKSVAARVGLSREHFSRIFTAGTGVPPAEYLRRIRAARARMLMRSGKLPLKEVALRTGFPSVKSLHRAMESAGHIRAEHS